LKRTWAISAEQIWRAVEILSTAWTGTGMASNKKRTGKAAARRVCGP
jgi:hypothetical protein